MKLVDCKCVGSRADCKCVGSRAECVGSCALGVVQIVSVCAKQFALFDESYIELACYSLFESSKTQNVVYSSDCSRRCWHRWFFGMPFGSILDAF